MAENVKDRNTDREQPTLYIAVPCYNEEEALPQSAQRLAAKLRSLIDSGTIGGNSRVLFINDGSRDGTWPLICKLHAQDPLFCGISLSRNRGHQNALLAGLMTAKELADAVISIDADLQDDIDAIDKMTAEYKNGAEIVYGVRSKRATDTFFKRISAEGFYRLLQAMGVEIVFNHADYRLMSSTALDCFAEYREVNLFLRGIVPLIGFKTAVVTYERSERLAGESKYPLKKMLALAMDGITSFSLKPLRMIAFLGGVVFAASLIALICLFAAKLAGRCVSGLSLLAASLWALGGVQLLSLGLVGEYVGKIYLETKARPRYFISERLL